MSPAIGTRSLQGHIDNLGQKDRLTPALHDLQQIVFLEHETYDKFTSDGKSDLVGDSLCRHVESAVGSEDILNLQFTSGTYTIVRYLKRNSNAYVLNRNDWLSQSCHAVAHVSYQEMRPTILPISNTDTQKLDQ